MEEYTERVKCIEGVLTKSHPENYPAIRKGVDRAMVKLQDYFKLEEQREAEDRDESMVIPGLIDTGILRKFIEKVVRENYEKKLMYDEEMVVQAVVEAFVEKPCFIQNVIEDNIKIVVDACI